MELDLYITFKSESRRGAREGDCLQFAQFSFGGATPTAEQQQALVKHFGALTSCDEVKYYPPNNWARVTAVGFRAPDERKFVEQVTKCARTHFKLKRVTHL